MCSLNQLYLTVEQHAHSTPRVSELARGLFAPGVGTSDVGPLGQGAGILTPGTSCSLWGRRSWHQAHGEHQTDRGLPNSLWPSPTVSRNNECNYWQEHSPSVFWAPRYYACLLSLAVAGGMERLWPCRYSRQQDLFIAPRATPLFMFYCHDAPRESSCSPPSDQLHIMTKGQGTCTKAKEAQPRKFTQSESGKWIILRRVKWICFMQCMKQINKFFFKISDEKTQELLKGHTVWS